MHDRMKRMAGGFLGVVGGIVVMTTELGPFTLFLRKHNHRYQLDSYMPRLHLGCKPICHKNQPKHSRVTQVLWI